MNSSSPATPPFQYEHHAAIASQTTTSTLCMMRAPPRKENGILNVQGEETCTLTGQKEKKRKKN